jgi:hypothetical protein
MSAYDNEEAIALHIARAAAQKILDEAIAESTAAGWSKYNGEWSVVQTGERYLTREYQGYIGRRIAYEMQLAGVIRSRSNSIASNASNGLATAQTQMIQMQISDATPSPSRSPRSISSQSERSMPRYATRLHHSQSFDNTYLNPESARRNSNIADEDVEAESLKHQQELELLQEKQAQAIELKKLQQDQAMRLLKYKRNVRQG